MEVQLLGPQIDQRRRWNSLRHAEMELWLLGPQIGRVASRPGERRVTTAHLSHGKGAHGIGQRPECGLPGRDLG
jgi:hypothetical protein